MEFIVSSCYKYTNLENPELVKSKVLDLAKKNKILGRILIGKEGINAAFSSRKDNIKNFKKELNILFEGLSFKDQEIENNAYHKLIVRIRKEIIAFEKKVNLENSGKHISPEELKQKLDNNESLIILDARNDYEHEVGKFKDAKTLPIKKFKDFPKELNSLKQYKDKEIVMYCTGGIRCEKSSAFLIENGFKSVSQLDGGIINFINKYPNSYFEGSNFVFDDRKTSNENKIISNCKLCNKKTNQYINCHNLKCDKLFLCCNSCKKELNNSCCERCKNSKHRRTKKQNIEKIGKITNYYSKLKVAEALVTEKIKLNSQISIKGKTTKLIQNISDLRDSKRNKINLSEKNTLISFPVDSKVRKNDALLIINDIE